MKQRYYRMLHRKSWVLTHEGGYDLRAAGFVWAYIYWCGGDYWALVEDAPGRGGAKTYIAPSFEELFHQDFCNWCKKDDFREAPGGIPWVHRR